jgi:hypothetical protein
VHVVVLLGISIVGLSVSARRIDELLLK